MKYWIKKKLTMTVHIPPRKSGPISDDERKQLVDFFFALLDLHQKQNVIINKKEDREFMRNLQQTMDIPCEKCAKPGERKEDIWYNNFECVWCENCKHISCIPHLF